MSEKRKYDSTVARIAGNLLSGDTHVLFRVSDHGIAASHAVMLARAIVAEVERTEPDKIEGDGR